LSTFKFFHGKDKPKNLSYFYNFQKIARRKESPIGENSPNLVTMANMANIHILTLFYNGCLELSSGLVAP
jgi:hypothetical protein